MSTTSHDRRPAIAGAVLVAALALSACGQSASGSDTDAGSADGDTITVETNNGEMTVPVNPERVVVLDNTAMETVSDLGVEPVALPKPLLPAPFHEEWLADEDILDIGNHREPNLEIVSEAAPDLIINACDILPHDKQEEELKRSQQQQQHDGRRLSPKEIRPHEYPENCNDRDRQHTQNAENQANINHNL